MKTTVAPSVLIALIAALTLCLGGCGEKLTYERFQMVSQGDSPKVVESILGEPWMKGTGDQAWVYQDLDRQINAVVFFQEQKVIAKRWTDAQRGTQGDSFVSQPGESHEVNMRQIK